MSNINNIAHLLLLNNKRYEVIIENKSYILVQPPSWVRSGEDEDAKVYKQINTGSAVVYVSDGNEMVIFDADIDEVYDSFLTDGIDVDAVEKMELEMVDVAWFV